MLIHTPNTMDRDWNIGSMMYHVAVGARPYHRSARPMSGDDMAFTADQRMVCAASVYQTCPILFETGGA